MEHVWEQRDGRWICKTCGWKTSDKALVWLPSCDSVLGKQPDGIPVSIPGGGSAVSAERFWEMVRQQTGNPKNRTEEEVKAFMAEHNIPIPTGCERNVRVVIADLVWPGRWRDDWGPKPEEIPEL